MPFGATPNARDKAAPLREHLMSLFRARGPNSRPAFWACIISFTQANIDSTAEETTFAVMTGDISLIQEILAQVTVPGCQGTAKENAFVDRFTESRVKLCSIKVAFDFLTGRSIVFDW